MVANFKESFLTVEEYLNWEETQAIRHEYIDGLVYAMAGGTLPHNDIAVNLTTALRGFLRGKGCKVRMSDAKVKLSEKGPFFYPDIVVSCHEQDWQARQAIAFPLLIVEVLSPSTAAFDRGDKFRYYRRLGSLQEYVLIDADKVAVDCYRRVRGNKWELTSYPEELAEGDFSDSLELMSVNFSCSLSVIYEDVELLPISDSFI
jgi:Uma2 family endonuclease